MLYIFHDLQEWLPILSLRLARSGHGVTVMDGCIYVAGGENDSMIYDSVESYDPAEHKWQVSENFLSGLRYYFRQQHDFV